MLVCIKARNEIWTLGYIYAFTEFAYD